MQILIYGYGNPGRQDDGLGVVLTQKLEAWVSESQLTGVEFDNNYQLNIEDAAAIAQKDLVIFADASEENIEDFCLSKSMAPQKSHSPPMRLHQAISSNFAKNSSKKNPWYSCCISRAMNGLFRKGFPSRPKKIWHRHSRT